MKCKIHLSNNIFRKERDIKEIEDLQSVGFEFGESGKYLKAKNNPILYIPSLEDLVDFVEKHGNVILDVCEELLEIEIYNGYRE